MLDLKFLRKELDRVRERIALRGVEVDWERFLELDGERRELIQRVEALRSRQNRYSEEISRIKREGGDYKDLIAEMRAQGLPPHRPQRPPRVGPCGGRP